MAYSRLLSEVDALSTPYVPTCSVSPSARQPPAVRDSSLREPGPSNASGRALDFRCPRLGNYLGTSGGWSYQDSDHWRIIVRERLLRATGVHGLLVASAGTQADPEIVS
jgi:hypothetical protein